MTSIILKYLIGLIVFCTRPGNDIVYLSQLFVRYVADAIKSPSPSECTCKLIKYLLKVNQEVIHFLLQ